MHGKRTTKDLLHRFQLIDEPGCDMCGDHVETNEHVLCHCIATQCTNAKKMVAGMMKEAVRDNGGGDEIQNVMT
jgi:hypothetical protein